jgi:hypothetical protein
MITPIRTHDCALEKLYCTDFCLKYIRTECLIIEIVTNAVTFIYVITSKLCLEPERIKS